MATNTNQRKTSGSGSAHRKGSARQRQAKQKKKVIIFGIEIAVILVMIGVLYVVMVGTDKASEIKRVELKVEELAIPSQVQEEKESGGTMHGYMNIALFGVDIDSYSKLDSGLTKGFRSDSTMIASVNLDTGDIKLVSVYRDTLLNLGNDTYDKCNGAYSKGGASQAIKMLNMNLDMDIENFITVGYKGLSEVIDGLGGIYIDIDSEEIKYINDYQYCIADVLKCEYTPVKETGYQKVDGIQAAAYCRIRYTKGDDFKRTARQREVIKAMEEQAKKADVSTLISVFEAASGDIYTSLDTADIMTLLQNINKYQIVDEGGFPEESMRAVKNLGAIGSCVIPWNGSSDGLEQNVIWLHEFLFDDEEYTVSSTVKECGADIYAKAAKYMGAQ